MQCLLFGADSAEGSTEADSAAAAIENLTVKAEETAPAAAETAPDSSAPAATETAKEEEKPAAEESA